MRRRFLIILLLSYGLTSYSKAQTNDNAIERFAKNIEVSINNKNPFLLNNSIDYAALIGAFIDNSIEFAPLNHQFLNEIKFSYSLGTLICQEMQSSGKIELLSTTRNTDGYNLLYRTFTKQGINYYELTANVAEKTIYLTDAYIYKTSMRYSTQLKSFYTSFLNENIMHSIERNTEIEVIETFEKINILLANHKYQKAFKVWDNLPDDIKYQHDFIIKAIEASSYFSTAISQQLIGKYSSVYGNDRKFYLLPLEGYFQRAEFDFALNSLDSLSLAVNNDPFLNLYRGLIYKEMRDIPNAEVHYRQFIEDKPFESTGYFSLLELYLSNNKHNSATEMLTQMTMRFGYYKQDFAGMLKKYPSFLNSEAYSSWINE